MACKQGCLATVLSAIALVISVGSLTTTLIKTAEPKDEVQIRLPIGNSNKGGGGFSIPSF